MEPQKMPSGRFGQLPERLVTNQVAGRLKKEESQQTTAGPASAVALKTNSHTGSVAALLAHKGGFGSVPSTKQPATSTNKTLSSSKAIADVKPKESSKKSKKRKNKNTKALESCIEERTSPASALEASSFNKDGVIKKEPTVEGPCGEKEKLQEPKQTIPRREPEQLPESLVSEQQTDVVKETETIQQTAAVSVASKLVPEAKAPTASVSSLLTSKGGFGFVPTKNQSDDSAGQGRASAMAVGNTAPQESSAKNSKKRKRKKAKTPLANTTDESTSHEQAVAKLRLALDAAYKKAEEFCHKAEAKVIFHAAVLQTNEESAEQVKDQIKQYKKKAYQQCQDKIGDIEQASASKETETRDYLKSVQHFTNQMDSVVKYASSSLRSLLNHNTKSPAPADIAEAQRCTFLLKDLNNVVRRQDFDFDNPDGIQRGDSVRLTLNLDRWNNIDEFVKEKVSLKSVGVFYGLKLGEEFLFHIPLQTKTVLAQFPECTNWKCRKLLVEKAQTKRRMPFIGDKVKLTSAAYSSLEYDEWDDYYPELPSKDSIGVLTNLELRESHNMLGVATSEYYKAYVHFPQCPDMTYWDGKYTDIELVDGCPFVPGQKVRIHRSIPRPSRGWGGINRSSVGSVLAVSRQGEDELVRVKFPECKNWVGAASDLEPVLDLKKGDKVQIKLTVDCAKRYKGRVTHEHVGEFKYLDDDYDWYYDSLAVVDFPMRSNFYCDVDDIEPVRYETPSYDKGFEAGIEGNTSTVIDKFDLSSASHFLEILSSA